MLVEKLYLFSYTKFVEFRGKINSAYGSFNDPTPGPTI
jgi:hypothetical protein